MSNLTRTTVSVLPGLTFAGIRDFIYFTRIHEWHAGKLPLLLGFVLTLSLVSATAHIGLLWIASAYLLGCLFLATAYMFNNIADLEQDSVANKRTGLEGWSPRAKAVAALAFATIGLGVTLTLLPVSGFAVMIGCYLLAWIYSFPPRLKEHFLLGPFVAAFAQVAAPALTLAVSLGSMPASGLAYLFVAFLYGLRMILVHQLLDLDNDRLALTLTTATLLGRAATQNVLSIVFKLEFASTLVFIILVAHAGLPKILLAALAWPLFIAIIHRFRRKDFRLDSYDYIPLADVHESLLPLILATGVAIRDGAYMIYVVFLMAALFGGRHFDRLVRPLTGWERSHG